MWFGLWISHQRLWWPQNLVVHQKIKFSISLNICRNSVRPDIRVRALFALNYCRRLRRVFNDSNKRNVSENNYAKKRIILMACTRFARCNKIFKLLQEGCVSRALKQLLSRHYRTIISSSLLSVTSIDFDYVIMSLRVL